MTPLAHKIMMDQCQRVKDRKFNDQSGLLPQMQDFHCFEITEVASCAFDIGKQSWTSCDFVETQKFQPAPRTWIEWKDAGGSRIGALLHQKADGTFHWTEAMDSHGHFMSTISMVFDPEAKSGSSAILQVRLPSGKLERNVPDGICKNLAATGAVLIGALAMINTPRIIGRVQHMPHRGLERALLRNQKLVGKFPLHAWTEIKLHVTPPREVQGEHEAHLTGQRALHFCRAHLRIKLGRLEFVRAHWRGDPAIGIRQSRYRLTT